MSKTLLAFCNFPESRNVSGQVQNTFEFMYPQKKTVTDNFGVFLGRGKFPWLDTEQLVDVLFLKIPLICLDMF